MIKNLLVWIVRLVLLAGLSACNGPRPVSTPTPLPPTATSRPTLTATPLATPTQSPIPPPTEPAGLVLEDGNLYVAIIWHQHQPVYYQDPETGIYERPWVRVHATKDYLDMAATVSQYPNVHVTFNLTPSLIRQLDDISAGAKDLYWVTSEVPAEALSPEQQEFLRARFFDTNPKVIARFPRYQELADQRDNPAAWETQDYLDLQILFNLAWTDPDWLSVAPLADLVARGRDYTEADKVTLFTEHLRIVQEVIPYHSELQQDGQIEVTMTPFAHPILPLLVDSNLAQVAMPDAELPSRFVYGQDAQAQVKLGVQFYQEHFGLPPRGMWPAEGSVAELIVSMVATAGLQWMATDEEVLANSLPDFAGFTRDEAETVQQADTLYKPYQVQGRRGDPVAIIFRDHLISDKVGFEYSGMAGERAAEDLIQRLENIQSELESEGASGPHLVTILLDGENAWEYYDNDGKEFLHGLYKRLSESSTLVSVTPSQYLEALASSGKEPQAIENLWPGSWIDGTFSTWIGELEENQAWEYLLQTREDVQDAVTAGGLEAETLTQVMETILIAEGSDWFWWYGADQNSSDDSSFDRQFRNYLDQIYTLMDVSVPEFVDVPIIPQAAQPPDQEAVGMIAVNADGIVEEAEWDGAGYYISSAIDISSLYYGFDQKNLYLRVDSTTGFSDETVYGFYLSTPRSAPANAYSRYGDGETTLGFGLQTLIEVTFSSGQPSATVYAADGQGNWKILDEDTPSLDEVAAIENVLEVKVPFARFDPGIDSGDKLLMRMVVSQHAKDVAVIPADGPAQLTVPDLPIPNLIAEISDPAEDDYGPGSYTYPKDGVFKTGAFDLVGMEIGYDDEDYIFRLQFRGPVINEWGSPNGLSIQTIDIYIDRDGPVSGERKLLPGRNVALSQEYAWDYAIWAEGWTPGVYAPSEQGLVQIDNGITILSNPSQRRVTIRVPRSLLEGDPSQWSIAAVVLSQEGYPSTGVWRVRDVLPLAEQWRIGGGSGSNFDTRILDVLWPEGLEPAQEAFLINPLAGLQVELEILTPDDYPQMPMLPLEQ